MTGTALAPLKPGRRQFLKALSIAGGGLLLGIEFPLSEARTSATRSGHFKPSAFIEIASNGKVTLTCPYVEMGQGTFTSIPMLVAEELEVDVRSLKVINAPANEALYAHPIYKVQITGGSSSIRAAWKQMRTAAATCRMLLENAAAIEWHVLPDSVHSVSGRVIHADSGRSAAYGDLVRRAATLPIPSIVVLKPRGQMKLVGTSLDRFDIPEKVNGTAKFGIDVVLPKMTIAAVAASPVFGGRISKVDFTKTMKVAGVRQVVTLDDVVAVIADHNGAARKGLALLDVVWDSGPNKTFSSEIWEAELVEAARQQGAVSLNEGDMKAALAGAARQIQATYFLPPLAHATMEPINCTVEVTDKGCEIWVGTQAPSRAKAMVAAALHIPAESVVVNNHLIGGGFGRRLDVDFIVQAALIGRHVHGPVKVIWSREEDIQHDVYRPFYYDELVATLDEDHKVIGLSHRLAGSSVEARYASAWMKGAIDTDAVDDAQSLYKFKNRYVEYVRHEPPAGITTGFFRGVGAAHNCFVTESFIDEIAADLNVDPVTYRRSLLSDNPRALAVLDRVTAAAGWGRTLAPRTGMGVSVVQAFGTYAAQVAEVTVGTDGKVKVSRFVTAVDCGELVNPDGVVAQFEGGQVFGLSSVLYGTITFQDGKVQQSNFHDYQVIRMDEAPDSQVLLIESHEEPGGVGELGTVLVAPSVLNAIYAATGKRLRRFPFNQAVLKV